jgi:hypothetical protein
MLNSLGHARIISLRLLKSNVPTNTGAVVTTLVFRPLLKWRTQTRNGVSHPARFLLVPQTIPGAESLCHTKEHNLKFVPLVTSIIPVESNDGELCSCRPFTRLTGFIHMVSCSVSRSGYRFVIIRNLLWSVVSIRWDSASPYLRSRWLTRGLFWLISRPISDASTQTFSSVSFSSH